MTDTLDEIVCKHLEIVDGGHAIGFSPHLRVEIFVDLLSAMLIPGHGDLLVQEICASWPASKTLEPHGIIAPKWGNPILGYEVARALSLPLLLARDDNLFGRWFDGILNHSVTWIPVDDVASDGERLAELVDRARQAGLRLKEARFIVARPEGDAMKMLEAEHVTAMALREWGDEQLRQLRADWRRS